MGVKSNFDVVNDDADSFAKVHNTNEIDEDTLAKIIEDGFDDLKKTNISYENSFINIAKTAVKDEIVVNKKDELTDFIKSNYSSKVEELLENNSQEHKEELVEQISKEDICTNNEFSNKDISNSIQNVVAMIAKTMVLEKSIRADKRGLEDIRNISIESNLLPYAHSSCLFTRGQTQALAIGTIAEYRDGQTYELLNSKKSLTENFMLHYNFPSFSVGEAKTSFGTTRRELGHGNLAKKALEPTINTSEFTDTFRVVSEILESNGSSSMATVCASSIALKGANIPTSNLVAGVAMGMIKDENSYAILSDITEFEDHFGDLDFKIAGTKNGITAMQMDVDSSGIAKIQTIKEVLMQAKRARAVILEKMEHNVQNMTYSSVLPMSVKFNVDPSSIFAIIGKAGSVIRGIIEQFDVAIDLDKDNGVVKISASDKDKMQGAVEHIKDISDTISKQNIKKNLDFSVIYEKDEKVTGVVGNTVDFGVFIKLDKGGEGLLHVSKIPQEKANNLNDNFVKDAKIEVTILNAYKDKIELKMED
jgi:polyribonucleotide nucleotidyltransferase